MKLLVVSLVLVILALVGSRQSFFKRHLPLGARHVMLTGIEFVFVGWLLGESALRLVDAEVLRHVAPLSAFGLGFLGFLFGVQLNRHELRLLPHGYLAKTLVQAAFCLAVVAAGLSAGTLGALWPARALGGETTVIVLAAACCCTAQSALAVLARDYGARWNGDQRRVMRLLRCISSLDGVVALVPFGLAVTFGLGDALTAQLGAADSLTPGLAPLFASLVLAAALAFVLRALTHTRFRQDELMLFVVGLLVLGTGVCSSFALSSLWVGFLAGVVFANISPDRARVLDLLAAGEKPMFMLVLLLGGAAWRPPDDWAALLLVVLLLRTLGKWGGAALCLRRESRALALPSGMGAALLSQGGLAAAIAMEYQRLTGGEHAGLLVTVMVGACVINELASPRLILGRLNQVRSR